MHMCHKPWANIQLAPKCKESPANRHGDLWVRGVPRWAWQPFLSPLLLRVATCSMRGFLCTGRCLPGTGTGSAQPAPAPCPLPQPVPVPAFPRVHGLRLALLDLDLARGGVHEGHELAAARPVRQSLQDGRERQLVPKCKESPDNHHGDSWVRGFVGHGREQKTDQCCGGTSGLTYASSAATSACVSSPASAVLPRSSAS